MKNKMILMIGLLFYAHSHVHGSIWGVILGESIGGWSDSRSQYKRHDSQTECCGVCGEKEKLGNQLVMLDCNHFFCESCIRERIDYAHEFNTDIDNVRRGIVKKPLCFCGKPFDYIAV